MPIENQEATTMHMKQTIANQNYSKHTLLKDISDQRIRRQLRVYETDNSKHT